uniref:PWWP domain-containing protein n=1 Tax=Salix viminalis TaxID=40686 RepID=A0A6N2NAT3_SALVM
MEIKDEQAKKSKCQNKDATSFDERVLQKNKNLKANGLNLLADLESYMGADGNAKMASKEAELSVGDLVWGKVRSHPWWLRVFCSNHHAAKDGCGFSMPLYKFSVGLEQTCSLDQKTSKRDREILLVKMPAT